MMRCLLAESDDGRRATVAGSGREQRHCLVAEEGWKNWRVIDFSDKRASHYDLLLVLAVRRTCTTCGLMLLLAGHG